MKENPYEAPPDVDSIKVSRARWIRRFCERLQLVTGVVAIGFVVFTAIFVMTVFAIYEFMAL
jgi:hypothetical protein